MATNVIYPQKAFINAVTNAQQAVVTFTADHDFTLGEVVSFRVTKDFGMFQLNKKSAIVQATSNDTITVDIDTTDWDAFDYSALNTAGTTPPVAVPCCSSKIPDTKPVKINQEAAFDNRRA